MGWLSWTAFYCETDCAKHPSGCINEQLYKVQADLMVSEGYKDVGYEYVNVDDCWAQKQRDPATKRMVADHGRFKSGIKALADYVHDKGLKFGLYTDIGTTTCAGYPGELQEGDQGNYFQVDAQTFAEWGIDSLKVDGCNVDTRKMGPLYEQFGRALNDTDRRIVYYCSMPFFQARDEGGPKYKPEEIDFELMAKKCNAWRFFDDINNSWASVRSIIRYYEDGQGTYAKFQGPGAWFDPDMILAGCKTGQGITTEQARSQFAFWSIMSAPLLMSNDLRDISPDLKKILQNKGMIWVNQDERGALAQQVLSGDTGIWLKPLAKENEFAALFYNWNDDGRGYVLNLACPIENIVNDIDGALVYDVIEDFKFVNDVKRGYMLGFDMEPFGVALAKLVVYKRDNGVSDAWRTGNITRIERKANEPFPCFVTRPR